MVAIAVVLTLGVTWWLKRKDMLSWKIKFIYCFKNKYYFKSREIKSSAFFIIEIQSKNNFFIYLSTKIFEKIWYKKYINGYNNKKIKIGGKISENYR